MARYQKTVQTNVVPIATAQVGSGAVGLTLADKLESFNLQAKEIATRQAITRGIQKASKVPLESVGGVTQVPQKEEVGFFGSVEAQAHNKALMAAYAASIDSDIRTNVRRIEGEHGNDLTAFNDRVEGFSKGLLENVDPFIRGQVSIDLNNVVSAARVRVQTANIKRDRAKALDAMETNHDALMMDAMDYAFNGDTENANKTLGLLIKNIDSQHEGGFITNEERQERIRVAKKNLNAEQIRRKVDQLSDISIGDANAAIASLEDNLPKGWKPEEHRAFVKDLEEDVRGKKVIANGYKKDISDKTERRLFGKLLDGTLIETDILNGEFDSEGKRTKWLGILQQNRATAVAAREAEERRRRAQRSELRAEESSQRAKANYEYTIKGREQADIQTKAEKRLDDLYSDHSVMLTEEMINESQATPKVKRMYRDMVKRRNDIARKSQATRQKQIAEYEIIKGLGQWSNADLERYVGILSADELYQWQQRNEEIRNDPDNYRNNSIFKQGYKDLENAKKNYLFVGAPGDVDIAQDDHNTQLFLAAVKEYERRSSEPGADFAKILEDIKRPYIEEASRGWFDKFLDRFRGREIDRMRKPVTRDGAETTAPDFGNRVDGTKKGVGFLGVRQRPDGGVSTEVSVSVNIDGEEMEIPTLVPTLTRGEIETILSLKKTDRVPMAIIKKAVDHAKKRMAQGKSPFFQPDEDTPGRYGQMSNEEFLREFE